MSFLSNVGSGAGAGAAIGSVVPGVGTVAGGVVGGLAGAFGGGAGGVANSAAGAAGGAVDAAGNLLSDASGHNQFTYQGLNAPYYYWGNSPNAAGQMTQQGLAGMGGSQAGQNWSNNMSNWAMSRGPTAVENQTLSNNDAMARGYDQAGSLQLLRQAAMGQMPSAAAYQMQNGLNQAVANQYATMGGARGNAGIALAQGNAGANIANLQNQTYNQASQLRAQEMANAQGLYNQGANTLRGQDQNRLQMANQMAQFNAQENDQMAQNYANNALGYANNAQNWYTASQNPYTQSNNSDLRQLQMAYDQNNLANQLHAGVVTGNADRSSSNFWNTVGAIGAVFGHGGSPTPTPGPTGMGGSSMA